MIQSSYRSTFSIVARDGKTGKLAVAGGSNWFAYATLVPFAKSGIGAIATQAETNITFGPNGLDLLSDGLSADQTLEKLLVEDEGRDIRQLLVIDKEGNTAGHTGAKCVRFARHHISKDFAVAGNMLANENVISEIIKTYEDLADIEFELRIIKALKAGQAAGGDIRGKKSVGMLVVEKDINTNPKALDALHDLRIDDHLNPFDELERLLKISSAYNELNLGDLSYFENDNKEQAFEHYKKAFELDPNNQEIKFWYAKLLIDMGDKEKGRKALEELSGLNSVWREYYERVREAENS